MTDLKKPVRRRTREPCPTTRRRWVVTLMPGDTFACREEGRRRTYMAPLSRICVQVVKWNVDAEKVKKRPTKVDRGLKWR